MAISKTELGVQVMKDRSVHMSAQQRSALILCDGKRSAEDVVRMTAAVGVTLQDIEALASMGLVEMGANAAAARAVPAAAPISAPASVSAPVSASTPAPAATAASEVPWVDTAIAPSDGDFGAALNAAISLCSKLGFKGFSLNMALTGVDNLDKLKKLAPEIRRAAGDAKYKPLHEQIFGRPL